MKITIKREQSQTRLALPNESNLRAAKNILLLFLSLALLCNYSCIRDPEENAYLTDDELFPVKIADLESEYVVLQAETLKITPKFETIDDENRYQYQWYVISNPDGYSTSVVDTLAHTKNLEIAVKLPGGYYDICFRVIEPQRNIYKETKSSLTVNQSIVTTGWYILKDENNETDFDYISLNGDMVPDVLHNISLDQQLTGQAKKIVYQSSSYSQEQENEDGTTTILTSQKVLHVISDSDVKTFNAVSMQLFRNFADEFYEAPGECSPENIGISPYNYDIYLMNAGKLYTINTANEKNVCKFGIEKIVDGLADCKLHDDVIINFRNAMVFEKNSRTFFHTSTSGTTLDLFNNSTTGLPSLKEMNANLVRMLERNMISLTNMSAYAIIENLGENDSYSILSILYLYTSASTYPVTQIDPVPQGCKMPAAKVMAAPLTASCIYFASDNVLNVYINANVADRECELYTFPQGETVSFIKNFNGKAPGDTANTNYLVVTTNTAAGAWKMYFFKVIGVTPDIESEPAHVFEGDGNARFVMYRGS